MNIPDRYPFAETVGPKGARCSTCKYVSEDGKRCRNKIYIQHHGSRQLGDDADVFCCMAWTPKGGR